MSLSTLEEHYEIGRVLGRGGFGVVYHAKHRLLQREVALKVLHAKGAQDRFVLEGQLLARLRHKNLVEVFDCGVFDDTFYLACELIEGETLTALLRRGPLTMAETTWVVSELLSGLAAAHQAGIWHRDVKPENVLIGTEHGQSRLKLLDFGVAKDELGDKLTVDGALIGTARYLAPEMLHGTPGNALTDLWAAGVLACECATGAPAYPGKSPEIYQEILAGPPRALAHLSKTELGPILDRLLAPAEQRVQSAVEAIALLSSLPQQPIGGRRLGRQTLFGTVADFVTPEVAPKPRAQSVTMAAVPSAHAARAAASSPPQTVAASHSPGPEPAKRRSRLPLLAMASALLFAIAAGTMMALMAKSEPAPAEFVAHVSPPSPVDTAPEPQLGPAPQTPVAPVEANAVLPDKPPELVPEVADLDAQEAVPEVGMPTPMGMQASMGMGEARMSTRRQRMSSSNTGMSRTARCRGGSAERRRQWQAAITCANELANEVNSIRMPVHADGSYECSPASQLCVAISYCGPKPAPGTEMQCRWR